MTARFRQMQQGDAVLSVITYGELLYCAERSQQRSHALESLSWHRCVKTLLASGDVKQGIGAICSDLFESQHQIVEYALWPVLDRLNIKREQIQVDGKALSAEVTTLGGPIQAAFRDGSRIVSHAKQSPIKGNAYDAPGFQMNPSPLNFPHSGFFFDSQASVFVGFLADGRLFSVATAEFSVIQTSDTERLVRRSLLSARFRQVKLG